MSGPEKQPLGEGKDSFEHAAEQKDIGLLREFMSFLGHSKKWWLTPIILFVLLVSALVILGGTGAAPFIYTLF